MELLRITKIILSKHNGIVEFFNAFQLADTLFPSLHSSPNSFACKLVLEILSYFCSSEKYGNIFLNSLIESVEVNNAFPALISFFERFLDDAEQSQDRENQEILLVGMQIVNTLVKISPIQKVFYLRNGLFACGFQKCLERMRHFGKLKELVEEFQNSQKEDYQKITSNSHTSNSSSCSQMENIESLITTLLQVTRNENHPSRKEYLRKLLQNILLSIKLDFGFLKLFSRLTEIVLFDREGIVPDADLYIGTSVQSLIGGIESQEELQVLREKFSLLQAENDKIYQMNSQLKSANNNLIGQVSNFQCQLNELKNQKNFLIQAIQNAKNNQLKAIKGAFSSICSKNDVIASEIQHDQRQLKEIIMKAMNSKQHKQIGNSSAPSLCATVPILEAKDTKKENSISPSNFPIEKNTKNENTISPSNFPVQVPPPSLAKLPPPPLPKFGGGPKAAKFIFDKTILPKSNITAKKINLSQVEDRLIPNSLWTSLSHSSVVKAIDFDLLELSFKAIDSASPTTTQRPKSNGKELVTFLSAKLSRLMSILLKGQVAIPTLIHNISNFNIDQLSVDFLNELASKWPEEPDIEAIKAAMQIPLEGKKYDAPELFFINLFSIHQAREKVISIRDIISLEDCISRASNGIDSCMQACRELKESSFTRNLFSCILCIGNFLNCSAIYGIKLNSLDGFLGSKSTSKTQVKEMAAFVAGALIKITPEAPSKNCQFIGILKKAQRFSQDDCESTLNIAKRCIKQLEALIERETNNCLKKKLQEKLESLQKQIQSFQLAFEKSCKCSKECLEYFAVDAASTKIEEFFRIILSSFKRLNDEFNQMQLVNESSFNSLQMQ